MRKPLQQRILATFAILTTVWALFAPVLVVEAASFTNMSDTQTRLKVSVTSVTHSFSLAMPASFTGRIMIVIENGYASLAASGVTGTCGGGGAVLGGSASANTGASTNTFTIPVAGCTGTLNITTGLTATNPSSSGSKTDYVFACTAGTDCTTLANAQANAQHSGTFATAIVTDDQVGVTASVDPSITFNVGAQGNEAYDCGLAFAGNGGTVALGTLTSSTITSSDVGAIFHICSLVSTNAAAGAIVTVKSANGALASIATPADTIPSATAAMAAGTANYGLCDGARSGSTTSTPASANPVTVAPFSSSCANDAAAGSVGAVTTSAQTIWSLSGPSSNGFQNIVVKAAISGTTKAHKDYADTLTFVATGTF